LADLTDAGGRIERELFGPPVTVGRYTVQTVAHMMGRVRGAGGGVLVTPVAAKVIASDGREQVVPNGDPTRRPLATIALVGLAVAAACSLVMGVRNLVALGQKGR